MSKEYLDAFKNLKKELYYSPNQIPDVDKWHEIIENALNRLEAIDNSNPSEALEELNRIDCNITYLLSDCDINEEVRMCLNSLRDNKSYEIIKQALLKAQKEHKALEILKKIIDFDLVEIGRRKVCIYSDNDDNDVVKMISEEEFNALEEVL